MPTDCDPGYLWDSATCSCVLEDTDGDGLPDWWEIAHFGDLSQGANGDPDGDGLSNLQEFQQVSNPSDYYSQGGATITPVLVIISGNNQVGASETFVDDPLVVKVTNGISGPVLPNAPVIFTVTEGDGKVALTNQGGTPVEDSLGVRTNLSGLAHVYFRLPEMTEGDHRIGVQAGNAVPVEFAASIRQPGIAVGLAHNLAWTSDGTLWAWGYNSDGELGDNSTTSRDKPVPVRRAPGMGRIAKAAAAGYHSVAVDDEGVVWAWGQNGYGQLGNNTTMQSNVPVRVLFPVNTPPITAVACGRNHTLALDENGGVWAWGNNGSGRLGNGNTSPHSSIPVAVTKPLGMGTVVALAASDASSYALDDSGEVWAWGYNGNGQLGIGNFTPQTTPVQVHTSTGLPAIVSLAANGSHVLARAANGAVWAWGYNGYGQLGIGSTTQQTRPQPITSGLTSSRFLGTGSDHSLGVANTGDAWAWGDNGTGQLGNNSTTQSTSPTQVFSVSGGLENVLQIAGGDWHSLALKEDGTLWAWGNNSQGRLGVGTTPSQSLVPVQVSGVRLFDDDSDEDGLPDSWELYYFGNLTYQGAHDFDNDDVSNADEYRLGLNPASTDTDADGMPDGYEVLHGLDPLDDRDALGDKDGDRVPNLWEYKRGTSPSDDQDRPAPDWIVDPTLAGTGNHVAAIQQAVDNAPTSSTNPAYYAVIEVRRGVYAQNISIPSSRKITLLGELGYPATEIRSPTVASYALQISGEAFVDGFRITRPKYTDGDSYNGYSGVYVSVAAGTGTRQVSVSNLIIHNHRTAIGAGLYLAAGRLRMLHTTISGTAANSSGNAIYLASSTRFNLVNSIIRADEGPASQQVLKEPAAELTISGSFIRGGEFGTDGSDPLISPQGWLRKGSPAIDAGIASQTIRDIHNEPRSGNPDAGADEFLDADDDGLPNWLESLGVTNPSADSDSDDLSNLLEYQTHGTDPLDNDTDGDGLNDGDEISSGTNPFDTDSDRDGMHDGWEVAHGFDPADPSDALEDADGDRIPNVFEFANGSDPLDSEDVPPSHLFVDAFLADETPTEKKTISAAINAAPAISANPTRYTIIEVKSGAYTQSLAIDNRRILLLGELGSSLPVVSPASGDGLAIFENAVVVDGFHFRRGSPTSTGSGIYINLDRAQDQARILNCVITEHVVSSGGAMRIDRGRVAVAHGTVVNNSASSTGRAFYISSNSHLDLLNSIVWNPSGSAPQQIFTTGTGTVSVLTSIVMGGEQGGIDSAPKLDRYHSLMTGSPAIGAGTPIATPAVDIHGEARPSITPDIGADQRLDSDADSLPDWWELHHFGDLSKSPEGDEETPQGDRLSNYHEYLLGFDPLNPDTAGSGRGDLLEAISNFTDPWYPTDWLGDPDNDGLITAFEIAYGFDPFDLDSTGTGILDGIVFHLGLDPNDDDWDGDGRTNLEEILFGSNPFVGVEDWGFVPLPGEDGDDFTAPEITLFEPTNATLIP